MAVGTAPRHLRSTQAAAMRTRDTLFEMLAKKTPDSLAEKLLEWTGRTDMIDKECFRLLASLLLGDEARAPEIDVIFDSLDMQDGVQDHKLDFMEIIRRARNEEHFAGKQKFHQEGKQDPRAGNYYGNKQLAKFEAKCRKKTDEHVRTYARVASNRLEDERRSQFGGIIAHRRMERDKMHLRRSATADTYSMLERSRNYGPDPPSPRALRSPSASGLLPSMPRGRAAMANSLSLPTLAAPRTSALARSAPELSYNHSPQARLFSGWSPERPLYIQADLVKAKRFEHVAPPLSHSSAADIALDFTAVRTPYASGSPARNAVR